MQCDHCFSTCWRALMLAPIPWATFSPDIKTTPLCEFFEFIFIMANKNQNVNDFS